MVDGFFNSPAASDYGFTILEPTRSNKKNSRRELHHDGCLRLQKLISAMAYLTSLPSAKVHSAKCSFVFANSSNFVLRSATSLVTLNSQVVEEVSVLISLTP
jgi:hypothetical protein